MIFSAIRGFGDDTRQPPSVSAVVPNQISAGSQITIVGSGFLTSSGPISDPSIDPKTYAGQLGLMGGNQISIGGYSNPALNGIVSPDGTTLTATIPADAFSWLTDTGQIASVQVANIWGTSNLVNVIVLPPAGSSNAYQPGAGQGTISPTTGAPGTMLTVAAGPGNSFPIGQTFAAYFEVPSTSKTLWMGGVSSQDGKTVSLTVPDLASGAYQVYIVYQGQILAQGQFAVIGPDQASVFQPNAPSYSSTVVSPLSQQAQLFGTPNTAAPAPLPPAGPVLNMALDAGNTALPTVSTDQVNQPSPVVATPVPASLPSTSPIASGSDWLTSITTSLTSAQPVATVGGISLTPITLVLLAVAGYFLLKD